MIFASKAGAPTNPDWYHNLKAHPNVKIEVGTDTIEAVASEASGEERERLYRTQAERVDEEARQLIDPQVEVTIQQALHEPHLGEAVRHGPEPRSGDDRVKVLVRKSVLLQAAYGVRDLRR